MIRAECWGSEAWNNGIDFLTIRTAGRVREWALSKLGMTRSTNTRCQRTESRLTSRSIGTAIIVFWACSLTLAVTAPNPDSKPEKAGTLTGKTLVLTLKEAVQIGLEEDGNTRVLLAMQYVRQAKAQTAIERANLLPNIDGSLIQQNRTTNLEAIGINFSLIPPSFRPPTFVGPFSTFDARVKGNQMIFDFSTIRRFQASKAGVTEAQLQQDQTRNEVTASIALQYLSVLRSEASLLTARANVALAQALLELAKDQKNAGTGTGIELTRADVQLSNARQQLIEADLERRKTQLQLLKTIGLPLDTTVEFNERLSFVPLTPKPLPDVIQTALTSRADLLAQEKKEEKLKLLYSAVKWERLPSFYGFGDYGSLGDSASSSLPTRAIGVLMSVPVFDGGRRDARRIETLTRLESERIVSQELRQQIELEVRTSLDKLHSSEEQVSVAEEGLRLAQAELEQAQRRYQAGITSGLEITDAQTRLERARENRVITLFQHNRAKIDLGQAMGIIQTMVETGGLSQ
jgi:outer membrane protein